MSEYFYQSKVNESLEVGLSLVPIQDMPRQENPDRFDPQDPAFKPSIDVIGQSHCGRVPVNLSSLRWEIKSLAPNTRDMDACEILLAPQRIVVQYVDAWELYDLELQSLAMQAMNPFVLALDSQRKLIYGADKNGIPTAWSLEHGKSTFKLDFDYGGSDFGRSLIFRRENTFLTTTVELLRDAHGAHKPNLSLLEIRELADPLEIPDPSLQLATAKKTGQIFRATPLLLAAIHKEDLILVCKNALYFADLNLNLKSAFTAPMPKGASSNLNANFTATAIAAANTAFIPLSLSVDERGLLHLVVAFMGKNALWVLDMSGRRLVDFPFLPEWGPIIMPPVIGYDHSVFLGFGKILVAVSPLGQKLWSKEYPLGISGITVTADGFILVSSGSELLALEPSGSRNVLVRLRGETLKTRAVFGAPDNLYVAGGRGLYHLVPKS